MLRYALTIFLSAFLLFQVQPLISKFILPWFGGTPAVWTTAMLFFQVLLLGGYTYAHVVATKLSPRRQMLVHLAVLAAAVLLLPIVPGDRWKPSAEGNPTWQILLLLGACVGLPYFVLATTSPLMQAWFTRTHPGRSPYRLYALSNVGSLLALLSFPFVFEPSLDLRTQGLLWSLAFAAVAVLTGYCALRAQAGPEGGLLPEAHAELVVSEIGNQQSEIGNGGDSPGWGRRLMWLALPACGSTMFLAVTNQMCLDVAVVPFFWVLPLSLYLLSFIICFDNERWYVRPVWWALMAGGVLAMLWLLRAGVDADVTVRQILTWLGLGAWLGKASDPAVAWTQILGYSLGLFACCMVCHGELVRLKPRPKHLTSFYLMVSAGGALGGIFVSLLAPHTFKTYLEFHIGLWATCALALAAFWVDKKPHLRWPVPWYAALGVAAYFLLAALILMFGPFDWLILGGDKPLRTPEIVGIWALEGLLLAVLAVIGRRRWWWLGAAGYFFVAFLMFGPFDWFGLGGGTPARTAETLSLWAIVGLLVAALAMAGRRRWWWLGAAGCFLLLGGALYLVPTKVKPEAFDLIDLLKLGLWAAWAVAVVAAWLARKPHRQWPTPLRWLALALVGEYVLIGVAIVLFAPFPYPMLRLGGAPVTARALTSLWAMLGLFVAGGWAFFERSGPRLLWWLAGACYAALHAALFALHAAKP
ncbi:MAG: hypothetical protein FJ290_32295, partial [Planctomycetes bacterium]|nr:hypothetical protein [Planctomycetota bacterium]